MSYLSSREKILGGTDRELRLWCAKLDGWKNINVFDLFGCPPGHRVETTWHISVPDYPNDIAAVWPLLEILPSTFIFEVSKNLFGRWICCIDTGETKFTAGSHTASRAISKTILLALSALIFTDEVKI